MDISAFNSFLKSQQDGFASFLKGCTHLDAVEMRRSLQYHSSKMFSNLTNPPIRSPDKDSSVPPKSSLNRPANFSETPTHTPIKSRTPTSAKTSSAPSSQGMTLGGVSRLFTYTGHGVHGNNPDDDDEDSSDFSPLEDNKYATSNMGSAVKKVEKINSSFEKAVPASGSAKKIERSSTLKLKGMSSRGGEVVGRDNNEREKKPSLFQKRASNPASDKIGIDAAGMWKEYEDDDDNLDGQTPSKKQKTGRKAKS